MSTLAYRETALNWSPTRQGDRAFVVLALSTLAVLLGVALLLSSIEVPEAPREVRVVPQRIVQFVEQRPKPKPQPPRERPVQVKPAPEPLPEPEPIVEVEAAPEPPKPEPPPQPVRPQDTRPALTEAQEAARASVQGKGLLGVRQGFAEVLDTSGIDAMVNARGGGSAGDTDAGQAATVDTAALLADAGQGSGGVVDQRDEVALGESQLAKAGDGNSNIPAFDVKETDGRDNTADQGGGARAEEDLKLVFDQNKSKLHTLYNRERRKHPGLKGRIVLELTIDEAGQVVAVTVVSSELNNEVLERRLVARIKQFQFGPSPLGTVTVTYPIEFLPS